MVKLEGKVAIVTGTSPNMHEQERLLNFARAAVFLASDDAEMITGFDLRVDAGAIAKYWPWVPDGPASR